MIVAAGGGSLLVMWVTFTVLALAGAVAVFVWAVRARQFSNQDRARYLALDDENNVASGRREPAASDVDEDRTDVSD